MAIVKEETVTGGISSGNSVSLTSWTPGSNELVLLAVCQRDEAITPTASGNGLTFVAIAHLDQTEANCGMSLFRAMGSSPTTGQITVTVTGNTFPVMCVATRFSGVDTSGTHGSGAVEASATDPGPAADDDDMLSNITTLTNNAWAFAAGSTRATVTFTVPAHETGISINNEVGSGGDLMGCHQWYQSTPTAGSTQLGELNDLSTAREWCMIMASIKPAGDAGLNISVHD